MIWFVHLIRRRPMVSFAVLACLLGWSNYIEVWFGLGSDPSNMPLGPVIAALLVTACQGRDALKIWGRRLVGWRAAPTLYAVAVLTPILVHLVIVGVNHLFGAPMPTVEQLASWPNVPITFLAMIVLVGLGEEGGWTAFAAPLLLRRHGLLTAWALLAGLRILWHVPLVLIGEMTWGIALVGNGAFQLLLLLLMSARGYRWSIAAVWHATLNAFGGAFFFSMVTGVDQVRLGYLLAGAYALLAAVALAVFRLRTPRSDAVLPAPTAASPEPAGRA